MPGLNLTERMEEYDSRFPNTDYLRFHYQLAEPTQLVTNMAERNFSRKTAKTGVLYNSIQDDQVPEIQLDVVSIIYKRQLLQDLLQQGISFDDYRENTCRHNYYVHHTIANLNQRYDIPLRKDIHIHECDFQDYKLEILSQLTSVLQEPTPPLYQFYNIDHTMVDNFNQYISGLKYQCSLGSVSLSTSRLDYGDIFID